MSEHHWAVWVFGTTAGVLVPILLVLSGWLMQLLVAGQHVPMDGKSTAMPDHLTVGRYFELSTAWLNAGGSILRGVLGIVVGVTA